MESITLPRPVCAEHYPSGRALDRPITELLLPQGVELPFVASIGGPITLFLAAGGLLALLGWKLFGESWQTRLARKIVEAANNQNIKGTLQGIADNFLA